MYEEIYVGSFPPPQRQCYCGSITLTVGRLCVSDSVGLVLGPDSHTVSDYFKIKVIFKIAILKSGLHQHLNLTYYCVVYIAVILRLKADVE